MIAVMTAVTMVGCGPSPITSARIEKAIARTFANLVQVQISRLGLPSMAASDFGVTASCRRLLSGSDTGAGEWGCTLVWHGPELQPLQDAYTTSSSAPTAATPLPSTENTSAGPA